MSSMASAIDSRTRPGRYGYCSMSVRFVEPVRTRMVSRPASIPAAMSVSMRSPTMTVVSECAWIRFADKVWVAARGLGDQRGDRPSGRKWAVCGRSACVGVRRNEPSATLDQPNRLGDRFEGIGPGLAQDHEVRLPIRERVANLVQRGRHACFTDDVRRPVRKLIGQKCG